MGGYEDGFGMGGTGPSNFEFDISDLFGGGGAMGGGRKNG